MWLRAISVAAVSYSVAQAGSRVADSAECVLGKENALCQTSLGKWIGETDRETPILSSKAVISLSLLRDTNDFMDTIVKVRDCGVAIELDFGKERVDARHISSMFLKADADSFTGIFQRAGLSERKAAQLSGEVVTKLSAVNLDESCKLDSKELKGLGVASFSATQMALYAPYISSGPGYGGRIYTIGFDLADSTSETPVSVSLPKGLKDGSFHTDSKNGRLYFVNKDGSWFHLQKSEFYRYSFQSGKEQEAEHAGSHYFEGVVNDTVYTLERSAAGIVAVTPTQTWHTSSYDFYPADMDLLKMNRLMEKMPAPIWGQTDSYGLYEAIASLLSSRKLDFISARIIPEGIDRSTGNGTPGMSLPAGLRNESLAGVISFSKDRFGEFPAELGFGKIYLTRANGEQVELKWDSCHIYNMPRYQWMSGAGRHQHVGFERQLEEQGFKIR
ncbi:hypothetical protein K2X33_04535 [bacterium]|nr:hypothetical protein [bacterium]